MSAKHCWFKIWLVGNGGMPYAEKYVFWPDYGDDEMPDMIEHELSYMIGDGTRSVNWETASPPQEVVLKTIECLEKEIINNQLLIEIHKKSLDN